MEFKKLINLGVPSNGHINFPNFKYCIIYWLYNFPLFFKVEYEKKNVCKNIIFKSQLYKVPLLGIGHH